MPYCGCCQAGGCRREATIVKRLAVVAPHFPEYALRYAQAMDRHCEVMAFLDDGQLADEFDERPLAPDTARLVVRTRFRTPRDLWRLLSIVRRFDPDVVHLQEAAGPRRAAFLALLALLLKRRALVVLTVHDPLPHEGRDQAAAGRTARVGAHVRHLADVFVAHGAYCTALVRRFADGQRQQVVPSEHGLILEPTSLRPPEPGPLRLYAFGRMEAYKGLEVLLHAAEQLHASGVPFVLTLAGRGPELDRLQDRFTALPEVTVHNMFVPPNAAMDAIQAAECVVLPYLTATQSGVLAAAYAGRRYVIASATGGLPDVVAHGENGLLVPPGDAAALAGAVQDLVRDPVLRARLLQGAAATAGGQLDWDRIAADLFGTLSAAAATKRALS